MASTEVVVGVVVGTIVGLVVSTLIIVFLLFWLGICRCPGDDDDEDDDNNAHAEAAARQRRYKGITLNTMVPPLSAAELAERDRVIARYKRRQAREERRARRRQRRCAQREGVPVDAAAEDKEQHAASHQDNHPSPSHSRHPSITSTTNTLTTEATTMLTCSAVAYGRGEYLAPPSPAASSQGRPHSGRTSSCGRHSVTSGGTLATLRGYMRELGRQRRLRRARRRRGSNVDATDVDILNQWETSLHGSSSSSSSSSVSSVGRRSIASSAPRPPEEILGRSVVTTLQRTTTQPFTADPITPVVPPTTSPHTTPASREPTCDSITDHAVGERATNVAVGMTETTPPRVVETTEKSSARRGAPSGNAGKGATGQAEVDVRRRKWTGRDVEQNVAISGFFAAPMQTAFASPRTRHGTVQGEESDSDVPATHVDPTPREPDLHRGQKSPHE